MKGAEEKQGARKWSVFKSTNTSKARRLTGDVDPEGENKAGPPGVNMLEKRIVIVL